MDIKLYQVAQLKAQRSLKLCNTRGPAIASSILRPYITISTQTSHPSQPSQRPPLRRQRQRAEHSIAKRIHNRRTRHTSLIVRSESHRLARREPMRCRLDHLLRKASITREAEILRRDRLAMVIDACSSQGARSGNGSGA